MLDLTSLKAKNLADKRTTWSKGGFTVCLFGSGYAISSHDFNNQGIKTIAEVKTQIKKHLNN